MTNEGLLQGPSHEQGGMPVVDPTTGQAVAEVEGDERLFSQEDTMQMEQMVAQAQELEAQDPAAAEQAYADLGRFVAEAIGAQDMANPPADPMAGGGAPPMGGDPMAAMGGLQAPPMGGGMPPMAKKGAKLGNMFDRFYNKN